MPKNQRPGTGKDKGSLTQKADDQDVRISQVSNVSAAVSAMGKKTTQEMQETQRRINEGGDAKEIAGSMNGVLASLKKTVDSLEKGVQTATLGTAKAAQDAIKQYGDAISEDFKVNRANMVASSMAAATPLVGYFASKFMETGILKKTKDSISEKISGMFKRKDKADDLGMGTNGANAAKSMKMSKEQAKKQQEDRVQAYKVANKEKYEKYDQPESDKMLQAVTAIQNVLGAQVGRFSQWYDKFLLEHPYYRYSMVAMKALGATLSTTWKAIYFFWRPRGGYKKHLSRSDKPLEAINQNIGALFVQTMPRLDAIMIYTKATAMATRDLSTFITGQKYERMDPSRLGGTWSLATGTMKFMRAVGKGIMGAARWGVGKTTKEGSTTNKVLMEVLNSLGLMGTGVDYALTWPGRLKDVIQKKAPIISAGYKEKKRLMGGLGATGQAVDPMTIMMMSMMGQQIGGPKPITDPSRLLPAPKEAEAQQEKTKKRWFSKIRMPKFFKGMGQRQKPHMITQGVYDLYKINKETQRDKGWKKLLAYTADSAKYLKQHDKREKRRSVWDFIKTIGSGIWSVASTLISALANILSNPAAWVAGALAAVGTVIVDWFHKNITPKIQNWVDKEMQKAKDIGKKVDVSATDIEARKKGDVAATSRLAMQAGIRASIKSGDLPTMVQNYADAFYGGRYEYMQEHLPQYGEFTVEEIRQFRKEHMSTWGARFTLKDLGWWPGNMNAEGARKIGRALEAKFLKWLTKTKKSDIMDDPTERAKWEARRAKLEETRAKHGDLSIRELDIRRMADAHKKFTDEQAKKKEAEKKKLLGLVDEEMAREYAKTYGGKAVDYIGKTYAEAKEIAKKYKEKFVTETKAAATITKEKVDQLVKEYGVPAKEIAGKSLAEATAYAKNYKEHITKTIKEKAPDMITTAEQLKTGAVEKAGEAKGWFGRQWEAIKKWASPERTGEYIEIGKGNFIEIYRQGKGKLKEMWETAAPEKKAIMKRELEKLMASGEVTAKELERMGIKLKDATLEAGEKVQQTVAATGITMTNNISETVNSQNFGGSNGNVSKFLQEKTMDDISRGDVLF